jgi:putative membrane protein
MKTIAATLVLLLMTRSAIAHQGLGGAGLSSGTWSYDPWLVVPLYGAALMFLVGTRRLWRRAGSGRGLDFWRVACFWAGWVILALALLSPLHWMSEHLLTAHMIEHELIMVVAAPLIIVSRPMIAALWALPMTARRWWGRVVRLRPLIFAWFIAADASSATALHIGVVYAWHTPRLFQAALTTHALHKLQHLSFFAAALLFWLAVLRLPPRKHGLAALHLFLAMMAMSLLGALLTLSPHLWYPAYSKPFFGFTPFEDQQFAGVVMWVPGCAVYAAAALVMMASWIRSSVRSAIVAPADDPQVKCLGARTI